MSVFKSRSIIIIILTCYSLAEDSPWPFICALILPVLPDGLPQLSCTLALISLIPKVIQAEPKSIVSLLLTAVVHVYFHGLPCWRRTHDHTRQIIIASKYLKFIYFFCFSFLSLARFKPAHDFALLGLCTMLFLHSVVISSNSYLRSVVLVLSYTSMIWGLCISVISTGQAALFIPIKHWSQESWWYYAAISFSNWLGFLLYSQLLQEQNQHDRQISEHEIEMHEIKSGNHTLQPNGNENEGDGQHRSETKKNELPQFPKELRIQKNGSIIEEILPSWEINQKKGDPLILEQSKIEEREASESSLRQERGKQLKNGQGGQPGSGFQEQQEEITNLFLLIPFTFSHPTFLQIPIYLYLIWLQGGSTPRLVFHLMFLSVCTITFLQVSQSLGLQIMLRLCLILVVNKNFKWAINITRIIRSIWLRSSFVFVLLILFWFSLLTVNLFHVSFVLIVLLFVSKNSSQSSNLPSFRHRNWKYLMLLFNIFLASRLVWLVCLQDTPFVFSSQIIDVLSIIGVTYDYGTAIEYFNTIPLVVSGVLTVQSWTYSSRIYDLESKQTLQFLPTYRALVLRILQILTIIYYKLIPWASHFVVLVIIISLQFSLLADFVLFWSLSILLVHMIQPNELSAYSRMYKMWEFFLKLISVQIALRYIFEFIKFPLIYTRIYQFPIIKTLINYQELFGLAIRESSISYVKNIFTKFQLMMILDFTIIAISFLTLEYYHIMIKYCEMQHQNPQVNKPTIEDGQALTKDKFEQKDNGSLQRESSDKESAAITNQDAIYIYENYIDFKITKWLENFNQFMLAFSKLFIKLYYPVLATFSSIYYSIATMGYFLFCVYYYLMINLKYYELYGLKQVQPRIMKLFHLWRLRNNIRVNLVEKQPINTSHILPADNATSDERGHRNEDQVDQQREQEGTEVRASTADPFSLYSQLKKEIAVTNSHIIFHNLMNLHARIRLWLLLLTMTCILLNYTSRLILSPQVSDLLADDTVEYLRYSLFILGASVQSPISINIYLLIVGLAVIQIKCCGLLSRVGISPLPNQAISPESIEEAKQKTQMNDQEIKQAQKFIDVSISLRFGLNKIMERFFVTLLIFVSLLENVNPFSIIYLVCAWFLNYMGAKSVQGLSWVLGFLVVVQYSLIISDTTNSSVGAESFPVHSHHSWLVELFNINDTQWIAYLTFGDRISQRFVMYLSLMILMLYQFCFVMEEYNWIHILDKMFEPISIGGISLKFYEKISQIYEYALVYSPLFIITLCLGLYLMDFTATNMFLSILSILFLFKSFLLENYTNSRPFWKSYFRILQLLIVLFMVLYCGLSTPMYNEYCNKILCSPEEFRTKITKTVLLLILQIGIDLISSHHFINAMATLESTLNQTSSFYRIAISIVQNDKKIRKSFESIKRKQNISKSVAEIRQFLSSYETDQTVMFNNRKQEEPASESWLNTIINFMPSFIDSSLIKGSEATRLFVKEENKKFIQWLESKNNSVLNQECLKNINEAYINQFSQCESQPDLKKKLHQITQKFQSPQEELPKPMAESNKSVHLMFREKKNSVELSYDDLSQVGSIRKSYIQGILPYENDMEGSVPIRKTNLSIKQEREEEEQNLMKGSRKTLVERLQNVNEEEKKTILYLQIFESLVSNWHYLTYFLMILQFIVNMGVLTLPFPFLTFMLGIVHSYQAPKNVWRLAFLALLPPIFFKYALQIEIVRPGETVQFILIGSNHTSIIIEYLLMFFIVVQCLILKIAGLYDKSTAEVECMHIALIRNIINPDEKNKDLEQERQGLYTLLNRSKETSSTFFQYLFSLHECKFGYDYSTLMVTVQLVILVYIFCFYDRMAIRQELSFYKMIEYNQFTTGMVVMAFIQLGFILLDRIMSVLELTYEKWDVTLILKYVTMATSLVYVHTMVIAFFPINSGYFGSNSYILIFYILHILYFLISSLQVKVGLNKQSRGFLDRYTWYNGYIYMFYRAIPFLFQFKVFSDWTFTKTSLRLFDWIKYEQILGFMYVAKCNSLFLRGKRLGSKIEWWKKLLMGFPLLLVIILLLFGPLILFSSLNPLSSLNEITGGYLQLSLRVNKTNEYPFYVNTHITDIHFLDKEPDKQLSRIIKTYELDEKSIQIVHLEPFSDQYWQISQGSYNKLIEEPESSLYELTMRAKFDRNQTKATPVYVLNTYVLRVDQVENFKRTLEGKGTFVVHNFVPSFMRLDNNNGLHYLTQDNFDIKFHAEESKTVKKKYWVIDQGITFKMASDKYSKAIFGYSVMSFYISIILMVANYFRSLFQGSAYTIIMSDIPYADPILSICDAIYQARLRADIYEQEMLFWTLIDIIRSPDLMKAITGNYLNARIETLSKGQDEQALLKPTSREQNKHLIKKQS